MRLKKIQDFLKGRKQTFEYTEEDEVGSIDFEYRGIQYHVWEYKDNIYGVETNIKTCGKFEEFQGDYESEIINLISDLFKR